MELIRHGFSGTGMRQKESGSVGHSFTEPGFFGLLRTT